MTIICNTSSKRSAIHWAVIVLHIREVSIHVTLMMEAIRSSDVGSYKRHTAFFSPKTFGRNHVQKSDCRAATGFGHSCSSICVFHEPTGSCILCNKRQR
jgi:hypothetical protein